MKKDIVYPREGYEIVGACYEVHNVVGNGFTEPLYQTCLEIELETREIPFVAQPKLEFVYKDTATGKHFVPDFVCFESIILEIKALDRLEKRGESQVLNYLKATGFRLGLLVNFGSKGKLEYKRIVK